MPRSPAGTRKKNKQHLSIYFRVLQLQRITAINKTVLLCFPLGLLLCANLYSVDWLDGQSTWPIYEYERIFIRLSSLMTGWSFPMQEQSVAPQWAMSILSVSLASFVKWDLYLVLVKRSKTRKKRLAAEFIFLYFFQSGSSGFSLLSPGQPVLDGK